MIGSSNVTDIIVNGKDTKGLVDTGSMVTTVGLEFLNSLSPTPEIRPLEDFELDVKCASGQSLPYLGYAEVDIGVKDLFDEPFRTIALVTHDTDFSRSTPLVLGTIQ